MTEQDLESLRYPIGRFVTPENITSEMLEEYKHVLANFPQKLKSEVENLNAVQLDTPYRVDGWTVRQVVHHCADSHMNAFIRFKLALTEDAPIIKPYPEEKFAELADAKQNEISSSIGILVGVHERLSILLSSLTQDDFSREYVHPQYGKRFRLDVAVALYAWHCNHHLSHITQLKKRNPWTS